jgi:MoaD family protein
MSVTVKIPTQLRNVTGGDTETMVDGASTVGDVLDGLYDRYDGLRDRIAEDGDLRRFVNVYVGGEDIRFLEGLDTPVEDGDEVTILPASSSPERTASSAPGWPNACSSGGSAS